MIFKPLNTKIEKNAYDITIQNLDIAMGHWGTEKSLIKFLDEIETISYDRDSFEKNLAKHCMLILASNIRTEDMKFYKDGKNIILLTIANRRSFAETEWLSRKINLDLKKSGFSFTIIEILKPEYKELQEGKKVLPETWILDTDLNKRVEQLKNFI